jgi:hypothetical protein
VALLAAVAEAHDALMIVVGTRVLHSQFRW